MRQLSMMDPIRPPKSLNISATNYFSGTAKINLFCQKASFLKVSQIEHMLKAIAMQHFPSATRIT